MLQKHYEIDFVLCAEYSKDWVTEQNNCTDDLSQYWHYVLFFFSYSVPSFIKEPSFLSIAFMFGRCHH